MNTALWRDWRRGAFVRRSLLIFLVTVQTSAGVYSMVQTLPYQGQARFELPLIVVFAILFSWISFAFWTAVLGFIVLWRGRDEFALNQLDDHDSAGETAPGTRTAILMPIFNEDVNRAFACLHATYLSLRQTGQLRDYDFYVLSDTTDPNKWVEEEMAWAELCQAVNGHGRIFYRHRRQNLRRKSGNIADFCRRWGANYEYMIVLDADSVMQGRTVLRLVELMQRRPQAGIIQTVSIATSQSSLFGRVQQFASHVYTPIFAAGIHFWSLGESPYWGHNAIIRVAPFMEHCALPRLPGFPPFGGEILSHDFVEAALLGRAGWEIWVAYNLAGSYEETPPTLLDELKRDQRWCQGNMQHIRLLFSRGIRLGHRGVFLAGILTYLSALLWLIFICLTIAEVALHSLVAPEYFSSERTLFPIWPRWNPEVAVALLGTTYFLLFLPKFLGMTLIIKNRRAQLFGGLGRLAVSVVLEGLISSVFAPIRMVFHSRFVLTTLMGASIRWNAQRRGEGEISFREALRTESWLTASATIWGGVVYWLDPVALWLFAPILAGLILAVPLTVYSGRPSFGRATRRWKLFLVPQELGPDENVVRDKQAVLEERQAALQLPAGRPEAFVQAIVEPYTNAVHIALSARRGRKASEQSLDLQQKLLTKGPSGLSAAEKRRLLLDGHAMAQLHIKAWALDTPLTERANEKGADRVVTAGAH